MKANKLQIILQLIDDPLAQFNEMLYIILYLCMLISTRSEPTRS